LGEILANSISLEIVDLRSVGINGNDAAVLFTTLQKSKALTSLDLSGISGINRNHIGSKYAIYL
jgi:hypothetical protein